MGDALRETSDASAEEHGMGDAEDVKVMAVEDATQMYALVSVGGDHVTRA